MDRRLSKLTNMVRSLREEPTMHVGNDGFSAGATATGPVAGISRPLFPYALDQDYQTPGESGLNMYRYSNIYPVDKVGEGDIDRMVSASNKYLSLADEDNQRQMRDRVDKFREMVRSLREEAGPTMSAGAGGFSASADAAGPVAGLDPKIDLRKRNQKNYNKTYVSMYRDLVRKGNRLNSVMKNG